MTTHTIKRLDQAALLTDPLKLQLMEQFSTEERTTKQVADLMKVKAPRLYRHVDALVEAGLLVLVREQPKRGTVERYYKAIATRFEIDPELFSAGEDGEADKETKNLIRQIFRDSQQELLSLMQNAEIATLEEAMSPIVMRLSGQISAKEYASLRAKLLEWMNECENEDLEEGDIPMRGLIAFYHMGTQES